MYAQTNLPFPNRIQLVIEPFDGPFVQDGPLGAFDPRRDVQVYIDGILQPVQTSSFDLPNNRYLLFMPTAINLQGVIQIIHHVPSPPFMSSLNGWGQVWGVFWGGISTVFPLGGFVLIASYSPTGP